MTTILEAVQTFWVITEDLCKSPDQETKLMNLSYHAHRPKAQQWWNSCVVNEFDPDEFLRITKDFLDPGLADLLGFMVDQVNNMTEGQEEEGE